MLSIPDKLRLWTQSVHPHLHTSRWENELGYIAASVIERLEARNTGLLVALKLVASEAYRLPSDCKRIITDEIAKAKGERT